jgi:hypothetical protein
MPFNGRDFSGSSFTFETEGDGSTVPARPVQRIKYDDILPASISSSATTDLVPAVTGKIIEIVSIVCTADATLKLRVENWDGTTATPLSPNFDVTAIKDFKHYGPLGSAIAKSTVSNSIRIALVSGTGNFTAWVQYRLK